MNVLVTSGGTREPIDGVRFISNFSTGKTGAVIADWFNRNGHAVTFIKAKGSEAPQSIVESLEFVTFQDLESILKNKLGSHSFDLVIHLAAVSDYSIDHLLIDGQKVAPNEDSKLSSTSDGVSIVLKRNHKIIKMIKEYSKNKTVKLVGFKLTNAADSEKRVRDVAKLFAESNVDFVVHNDLTEISGNGIHKSLIFSRQNENQLVPVNECLSKSELAQALEGLCKESL